MTEGTTTDPAHPEPIGQRYRVIRLLGRGGMGEVFEVRDDVTGRHLALKRMLTSGDPRHAERFEQEYLTLAQLAHPRIVDVYDYSTEGGRAFYTMELLDGGDLKTLAPLPWREATALLCDVCCALSLLHSRRVVHRDLTPRNVRCTKDGKAKLLDFGAMTVFGPARLRVGTPAYSAPEAVTGQALDARTDVFALGATAYFALTGRHAYPAPSFSALHNAWRSRPRPPSKLVELPRQLDELVLSMIQPSPLARPASAAEVMEQLCAIGGIELDEQLLVRQAYLSAPTLVARDAERLRVRKQLIRTMRGRGGSLVVTGARGVGRSRFLESCVLEGKLLGFVVARVDTRDGTARPWGGADALLGQLEQALPEVVQSVVAEHATTLAGYLPRVAESFPDALCERDTQPRVDRGEVHKALTRVLREVARIKPTLIAADDIERIDEPTAALIALASTKAKALPLSIIATTSSYTAADDDASVSLLRSAGASLTLSPIRRQETEKLLESVFGDAPNLKLLAERLHTLAQGVPGAVMQLAQHLLHEGAITYHAGSWSLPGSFEGIDLPQSIEAALQARVAQLSEAARTLSRLYALSSLPALGFSECSKLIDGASAREVMAALDEMVSAGIVTTASDNRYTLSNTAWLEPLLEGLSDEATRKLHLKLAEMFEADTSQWSRATQHALLAGDLGRALDIVLPALERNPSARLPAHHTELTRHIANVQVGWPQTLEKLLSTCDELSRPKRERFLVQRELVRCAIASGRIPRTHLREQFAQLRHDSGLDRYAELAEEADPEARMMRALKETQARYDQADPRERVLQPADAIRALALTNLATLAIAGRGYDYELAASVPSLRPFITLSSALEILERNVECTQQLLAGRSETARRGWLKLLDDVAELDPEGKALLTTRGTAITYAIGLIEAMRGMASASERAAAIESDPQFEVNAHRVRLVAALQHGRFREAEGHRERLELLQIRNRPAQYFEGSHVFVEAVCYSQAEDLSRIKHTLPALERMIEPLPSYEPCFRYAQGAYYLLRGDLELALSVIGAGLELVSPGRHIAWPLLAALYLRVLLRQRVYERARGEGARLLETARAARLDTAAPVIRSNYALALAGCGEHEDAMAQAKDAAAHYEALECQGIALGAAYEVCARVALLAHDAQQFERYAKACAEQYRAGSNPTLTAKYERLLSEARGSGLPVTPELSIAGATRDQGGPELATKVATLFAKRDGPQQRAALALDLLLAESKARGGLLYTVARDGPRRSVSRGHPPPPGSLDDLVVAYLSAELDETLEATLVSAETDTISDAGAIWLGPEGDRFCPVLLSHDHADGFTVSGLFVACVADDFEEPKALASAVSRALTETDNAGAPSAT